METFIFIGRDFHVVGRIKKEGGRDRTGEIRKGRE